MLGLGDSVDDGDKVIEREDDALRLQVTVALSLALTLGLKLGVVVALADNPGLAEALAPEAMMMVEFKRQHLPWYLNVSLPTLYAPMTAIGVSSTIVVSFDSVATKGRRTVIDVTPFTSDDCSSSTF